jgi:hypothetical protein
MTMADFTGATVTKAEERALFREGLIALGSTVAWADRQTAQRYDR